MKTFKEFYKEAVSISKTMEYAGKAIKSKAYKDFRNDLFKESDRLILPDEIYFKASAIDSSILNKFHMYLQYLGFGLDFTTTDSAAESYMNGLAYPIKGPMYDEARKLRWIPTETPHKFTTHEVELKSPFKIGKIINAFKTFAMNNATDYRVGVLDTLMDKFNEFQNDPQRIKGFTEKPFKVVISRHPYDIVGMSTDRSWTSCVNLGGRGIVYKKSGVKRTPSEQADSLKVQAELGGLVAYLVPEKEIDQESGKCQLRKPISRIAIPIFFSSDYGPGFGVGKIYGSRNQEFYDTVKDFVENELNAGINRDVEYYMPHGAYDDEPYTSFEYERD